MPQAKLVDVDQEDFRRALRGAYDDPWWREFIKLVEQKRSSYLEDLVTSLTDQRSEDRTRGAINELTWFLALDMAMKNEVKKQKEEDIEQLNRRDRNGDR